MKLPPDMQKLETMLKSSKLVSGGFLGDDPRPFPEIIETDLHHLARLGYTQEDIARRMWEITQKGKAGLGTPVRISPTMEVIVDENRGLLVCPWPHPGNFRKTLTKVTRVDTDKSITWSNLCIHLIEAHGFFQGRESRYRLEPEELVAIIF